MRNIGMIKAREILRLKEKGFTLREIAKSCGCGKSTVSEVLTRATTAGVSYNSDLNDKEFMSALYPVKERVNEIPEPDMNYVFKELKKKNVTLMLLWEEYKAEHPDGVMYSQFCQRYRDFKKENKIEMHKEHKAGEEMEVDWAGSTVPYEAPITKSTRTAFVFVSVLPASHKPFAYAFSDAKCESWIEAHTRAFEYYGGVPKILIPDNTKTAVTKSDLYEPVLNATYYEMAKHYNTTVIPARAGKPKDKGSDENAVKLISNRILAALRNEQFFSLKEINDAISRKLEEVCERPFQKREGNRNQAFIEIDKPALMPLPSNRYEVAHFKETSVPFNYHVEYEGFFYSVPHEHISTPCSVRASKRMIEIFIGTERIAVHERNYNPRKRYRTLSEHMPENHKAVSGFSDDRFISWAGKFGENTKEYIKYVLSTSEYSVQSYRTCMGIMRLAESHESTVVEASSKEALMKNVYACKYFKMILKQKDNELSNQKEPEKVVIHKNIRGADAFKGGGANA